MEKEKKCLNCAWFVNEEDLPCVYTHKEAVRMNKGFCLLKPLFTYKEPSTPSCKEYVADDFDIY